MFPWSFSSVLHTSLACAALAGTLSACSGGNSAAELTATPAATHAASGATASADDTDGAPATVTSRTAASPSVRYAP